MMKKKRRAKASSAVPGSVLAVGLSLLLPMSGAAAADEPVSRSSPAQDCAIVSSMPGFPQLKEKGLMGEEVVLEGEGVVIRRSRVRDGKIVIPPAGLYYTVRNKPMGALASTPILFLGKKYYMADMGRNYGVKRDFVVEKGDPVPYGQGQNALELSGTETAWDQGSGNWMGYLRVLKSSGNYYGSQWTVVSGGAFSRTSDDALGGKPLPGPIFYQQSPLASVGTSYLIAREIGEKTAKVAEWAFSEVTRMSLAAQGDQVAVGVGETVDLGRYRAKVLSIDPASGTARVAVTDARGQTLAEKKLGPLTDKVLSLLPSDDTELATMLLRHDDVEVALAAFNSPFSETGKVKLLRYAGILETKMGEPLKEDPRFFVYPDT